MIIGDLNAKVEGEEIFRHINGGESKKLCSNDNGKRLVKFAKKKHMKINEYLLQKKKYSQGYIGDTRSIPAEVAADASQLDGELLHYRVLDENHARRSGLWNIRLAAPALKPAYERIEQFEDDWTRVQDKDGWGIVNREGQWVVRPTHEDAYRMTYLGNGFMLVHDAQAKSSASRYAQGPYRMIDRHIVKQTPDRCHAAGQAADANRQVLRAWRRCRQTSATAAA